MLCLLFLHYNSLCFVISGNGLLALPDNFGNLSLLQHLDLFDNKLNRLPLSLYKVCDVRYKVKLIFKQVLKLGIVTFYLCSYILVYVVCTQVCTLHTLYIHILYSFVNHEKLEIALDI